MADNPLTDKDVVSLNKHHAMNATGLQFHSGWPYSLFHAGLSPGEDGRYKWWFLLPASRWG